MLPRVPPALADGGVKQCPQKASTAITGAVFTVKPRRKGIPTPLYSRDRMPDAGHGAGLKNNIVFVLF